MQSYAHLDPDTALARIRELHKWHRPVDRPSVVTLADDRTVMLLAPRVLAERWVLRKLSAKHEVYRRDGALARRPIGSTEPPAIMGLAELVDAIERSVRKLPDREDSDRPYKDLRVYIADGDRDRVRSYLFDVARSVRRLAPVWRDPAPRRRAPGLDAAARARKSRADRKRDAAASAAWWLGLWLEDAPDVPGGRVSASKLYVEARTGLESWAEEYREDPDEWADEREDDPAMPRRPIVPGRTLFYEVADRVLGARVTAHGGIACYVIPDRTDDQSGGQDADVLPQSP